MKFRNFTLFLMMIMELVLFYFTNPNLVGQIVQFFFLTVICTAGVTLVVWVPLILLAISIIIYINKIILSFIFKENWPQWSLVRLKKIRNEINKNSENRQISIGVVETYIINARSEGKTDDVIKHLLKFNGGWNDDDISSAFDNVKNK